MTKKLSIKIIERADIEEARLLHNDPSTLFKLTDIDYVSESEQEQWFESLSLSKRSRRYVVRELLNNDFVGVVRIDQIDLNNKSACIGLDITYGKRGNGFAKDIYAFIFEYYFKQKGFHRLYLATLETNQIALNLYENLGFKREGISREAIYRDGKFVDLIWMSLLQREYNEMVGSLH